MTADEFTRPERAAQIRQAKRYKRAIEKRGICCACKHRAIGETKWGRSHCRVGGEERQHPTCDRDGKGIRFEFDDTVLGEFADAA